MSKPVDRFDLEQAILNCWGVTDDLRMAAGVEGNVSLLNAIGELYDARFEELLKILSTITKEGKFK